MSRIEKEIKKIREDLKEIKSDLKTFLTDETSKDYVQQLIDNVNKGNLNVGDSLTEEEESLHQEYLDQWTCDICGKYTHEVEYDYLGSNRNHLDCELKDEIAAMEAGVDVKASKESN
jgi:uncharacterized protein (UPF0335 family)